MAEQSITGSIAAPGFFGLNTQDSSVQLNSGFALEANNCVIDKYGRIGARKGWTPVNDDPAATDSFRAIYELIRDDGKTIISAAGGKIYTGDEVLTRQYVMSTTEVSGTYSQTTTVITITKAAHGLTSGTVVYVNFTSGTAFDGYYTITTVPTVDTFTITSAVSATTSGNVKYHAAINYAIAGDNWQISGMPFDTGETSSAHAVMVQEGQPVLMYHKIGNTSHLHTGDYGLQRLGDYANLPTGYTVTDFTPNCVLTSYGRTWVADIANDRQTVYFSDLLNPSEWKTGTAGYLNIGEVVPNNDPIVALAAHNGFLIIFCRRHIVVYKNALDPSTLTLEDVISGVGCIARDSVQSIGTDLMFLSETGVQSFLRVVQEKSLPFRDVSKNVRDDLLALLGSETEANIKAIYYPSDAFYLLAFPSNKLVYCFDTRGVLENGAARTTVWTELAPTAFCVTQDRKMYIGQRGYIGNYTGYEDNTVKYRFSYYTNYFDFDQPSILKILKKINMIAIGGSGQPIVFKWAFDYNSNYNSGVLSLDKITIAEYNIAEYGTAEYTNGIALDNVTTQASGTGRILQLGFEADIDGAPLSIQKIDFSLKSGKTVI
jgi:hypothetical protein